MNRRKQFSNVGVALMLVCLAGLESALFAKALWLFLAGTIVGGIGVGLVFRGGLSSRLLNNILI